MKSFPFVLRRLLPCLFVMVLSSCELLDYLLQEEFPQDEKAEIVIGSDKEIKVNPEGESVLIGFTSSHSWDLELKFTSDDEWITADKTSGQPGTVSLRLTVLANDTEQMRKAEMTISSGDTTATVILAQEPKGSEDTPSLKILSEDALFFLVNSYTTGLQPAVLTYMIHTAVVSKFGGKVEASEIGLPVKDTGLVLPCGASGRWTKE